MPAVDPTPNPISEPRARHEYDWDERFANYCIVCDQDAPCRWNRLLDERDQLAEQVRELEAENKRLTDILTGTVYA